MWGDVVKYAINLIRWLFLCCLTCVAAFLCEVALHTESNLELLLCVVLGGASTIALVGLTCMWELH